MRIRVNHEWHWLLLQSWPVTTLYRLCKRLKSVQYFLSVFLNIFRPNTTRNTETRGWCTRKSWPHFCKFLYQWFHFVSMYLLSKRFDMKVKVDFVSGLHWWPAHLSSWIMTYHDLHVSQCIAIYMYYDGIHSCLLYKLHNHNNRLIFTYKMCSELSDPSRLGRPSHSPASFRSARPSKDALRCMKADA